MTALRAAVLTMSLLAAGLAAADQEALTLAQDLRRDGDLTQALILLKNQVTADPGDLDALRRLAEVQLDLYQGDDAEQELREAQQAGAPRDLILPLLLRALLQQDKYQQVLDELAAAESTDAAGHAELLALKGMALLGLLQYEAAQQVFEEARSLIPNQVDAMLGQARLALAGGDIGTGRARLQAATRAHPESAEAWLELADLQHANGAFLRAEQALIKARVVAYNKWVPRFKRALVRMDLGQLDMAEADLDAIEAELPGFAALHFGRGMLLLKRGDVQLGIEAIQEYLRYDPGNPEAMLALATGELARANAEPAEDLLRRYLRARPGAEDGTLALARLLLERQDDAGVEALIGPMADAGTATPAMLAMLAAAMNAADRPNEALRRLRQAIDAEPRNSAHRLAAADLLMTLGRPDAALAQLDAAIAADPLNRSAPLLRIKVLLGADRRREAVEQAEQLARLRRDDPAVLNALGLAQLGLGRRDAAADTFEQALSVAPGDLDAGMNLFRLRLHTGDRAGARAVLEGLVAARPGATEAIIALADLDRSEHGQAAGRARLEEALDDRPDDLGLRLALARADLDAGEPLRARALLRSAPTSQLTEPELTMLVGESQLASGETDHAIKTYLDTLPLAADKAPLHYRLASAYAKDGRLADMEAALKQGLTLNGDDPLRARAVNDSLSALPDIGSRLALLDRLGRAAGDAAWLDERRADLMFHDGDLRGALAALARVQVREPDNRRILHKRVILARKLGDLDDCRRILEEWVPRHPADAAAGVMLAQLEQDSGETDAARERLLALYEDAPGNPAVLNNLAELLRDSNPERALTLAEQAARLAPGNAAVNDTLGALLLRRGDLKRALDLLRQAHAADSIDPDIALNYAEALVRNRRGSEARVLLADLAQQSFDGQRRARALLESLPSHRRMAADGRTPPPAATTGTGRD